MKAGDTIKQPEFKNATQAKSPLVKVLNGNNYGLVQEGFTIAWVVGNKVVISVDLPDLVNEGEGSNFDNAVEYIASKVISDYARLNNTSPETSGE